MTDSTESRGGSFRQLFRRERGMIAPASTPEDSDSADQEFRQVEFCNAIDEVNNREQSPDSPSNERNANSADDSRKQQRDLNAEPYVSFLPDDLVGLALSGGGIRSATFNLGVLQGLHSLGLLPYFDYLSTVSGGGYIGAWWSTWLRYGNEPPKDQPASTATTPQPSIFPGPADEESDNPRTLPEPREVRHIREFSNFLSPRRGFFSADMWDGIVSIISGMLPSLAMAALLLFLAALLGNIFRLLMIWAPAWTAPIIFVAGNLLIDANNIIVSARGGRDEYSAAFRSGRQALSAYATAGILTTALLCAAVAVTPNATTRAETAPFVPVAEAAAKTADKEDPTDTKPSIPWNEILPAPTEFRWSLVLAACAGATLLLRTLVIGAVTAGRTLSQRDHNSVETTSPYASVTVILGRVAGRLFIFSLLTAGFTLIWSLGSAVSTITAALSTAASLMTLSGAFRFAISTLQSRQGDPQSSGSAFSGFIRLLPQLLAYLVVAISLLLACAALRFLTDSMLYGDQLRSCLWILGWTIAAFAVLLVTVDPQKLGLHSYYRQRLARTFTGGARGENWRQEPLNRGSLPRPDDDFPLSDLTNGGASHRPFHLICTTANDLSFNSDQLASLRRGGRSAVFSGCGFSIADAWHETNISIASAMTASGAAANSSMGQLSMTLGPSVSFVLTALNIRLGLWHRHPLQKSRNGTELGFAKGWYLIQEMLNLTTSEVQPKGIRNRFRALFGRTTKDAPTAPRAVHLSDGGHFENLGVYELIRRHCRYIVVCDATADPDLQFQDFGVFVRRIRQDFGVEIEIDLSVLQPDSQGHSSQHAAVGTIHYQNRNDKGVLVYMKPGITGDEPDDILQYLKQNTSFPHEGTLDQFYSESQWESYRRLGEHAARSIFRFVEHKTSATRPVTPPADRHSTLDAARMMFAEAAWRWSPEPETLRGNMLELTSRFRAMQETIRNSNACHLAREMYPEFTSTAVPQQTGNRTDPTSDALLLTQVIQLMEDAYVACDLERHRSHPLNAGWMNLFHRWAQGTTFRQWWPVLAPMYSRPFRLFANRELELGDLQSFGRSPVPENRICINSGRLPQSLFLRWKQRTSVSDDENDNPTAIELFKELKTAVCQTTAAATQQTMPAPTNPSPDDALPSESKPDEPARANPATGASTAETPSTAELNQPPGSIIEPTGPAPSTSPLSEVLFFAQFVNHEPLTAPEGKLFPPADFSTNPALIHVAAYQVAVSADDDGKRYSVTLPADWFILPGSLRNSGLGTAAMERWCRWLRKEFTDQNPDPVAGIRVVIELSDFHRAAGREPSTHLAERTEHVNHTRFFLQCGFRMVKRKAEGAEPREVLIRDLPCQSAADDDPDEGSTGQE